MKRILTLFLVLTCAWIASGGPLDSGLPVGPSSAGGGTKFPIQPPLTTTQGSLVFNLSATQSAIVATSPSSGSLGYSSSDPAVATVSSSGVVSAVGLGSTNVTVNQSAVGQYFSTAQTTVPVTVSSLSWTVATMAVRFINDDYAGSTDSDLPSGNHARTMMCWMYDYSSSTTGLYLWMGYGSDAANQLWYFNNYAQTFRLDMAFNNYRYHNITREGAWHHFAVTLPEGGTLASASMYLDGVKLSSPQYAGSTTVNTTLGGTFRIGTFLNGGYGSNTKMSEVAIYNRELSESEIALKYQTRLIAANETGLLRLYHCDEGTGTAIIDYSGNGKNLTISGASWAAR